MYTTRSSASSSSSATPHYHPPVPVPVPVPVSDTQPPSTPPINTFTLPTDHITVEICVDHWESILSIYSYINKHYNELYPYIQIRLEICTALQLGGLTPSIGMIQRLNEIFLPEQHDQKHTTSSRDISHYRSNPLQIPFHILLRDRAGDFLYNNIEIDSIKYTIQHICQLYDSSSEIPVSTAAPSSAAYQAHSNNFVFGCLNSDDSIDINTLTDILQYIHWNTTYSTTVNTLNQRASSSPLPSLSSFTFHRAIDLTNDILAATTQLINISQQYRNLQYLLTSGGASTAIEGKQMIQEMNELCVKNGSTVQIIAAGGIDENNVIEILDGTGVRYIHGSFREARSVETIDALPVDTEDGICVTSDERDKLKRSIEQQQQQHDMSNNQRHIRMGENDRLMQYVITERKLDALFHAIRRSQTYQSIVK